MVDRIEQKEIPPYRVREVEDSTDDKNKGRREEEDNQQKPKSFFSEKTDWRLLYEKNPHVTKIVTVTMQEIQHFLFQNVSLKNNPSILEAVLVYKNGSQQGPVFISLPRDLALRLQHAEKDDRIGKEIFGPMHYLQVMIPEPVPSRVHVGSSALRAHDTLRQTWERGKRFGQDALGNAICELKKRSPALSWEWILLAIVILLVILFFISIAIVL